MADWSGRSVIRHMNLPTLFRTAGKLMEQSRFVEAAEAFAIVCEKDPRAFAAWLGMAWALARSERYAEAVGAAERAIELNPRQMSAWSGKGYALLRLNRFEDALVALDRSIALRSDHAFNWTLESGCSLPVEAL